MKRIAFICVVVAIIAVILLARQKRTGEEETGVTLRFSFWGGESERSAIEDVCRRFEALHPDIHIRTEPLPWGDYWIKMKTLMASGSQRPGAEPPDVVRMTSLYAAEWYYRGLLRDLTPYLQRDHVDLDAYFPANIDAVSYQASPGGPRRVFSMPTDTAVRVLMYNKDLFDRAGIPYPDAAKPMTWTEYEDLARQLTVVKDGQTVQYGLSLGYMEYQAFVAQAGGCVVDDVSNPRCMAIDTPAGVRGLDFYSGLIVRDKASPPMRQQQNLGFGAPDWALVSGTVAIQHGGVWSLPGLATAVVDGKPLRFGLAPVPMDVKRSQVAFTNSYGIYVNSRHADEAWLFLKFFSSAEGQKLVAQRGIGIPVMRDVARSDAFLKEPHGVEHMEVFLDEMEHAETNVCAPTEEWRNEMEKIFFDQLCLGSIDAQAAARRMQVEGSRILAMKRVEATRLTGVVIPAILAALALVAGAVAWVIVRRRRNATRGQQPTRSENLAGYLFILPWLAGVALFAVGPVLLALGTSVTDWNIFRSPRYVGVENYATIVAGDGAQEFWKSLRVTVVYAATAIPIQLAGGLLCALFLNMRGVRLQGFFRTALYLPYLFTGVAISLVWRWMYTENGLVNHLLACVGLTGPNWLMSETWALPALILINFTWLGGNMIIFLAALQGVPQSLYDAAQVDGAGPVRRMWHVTLPMISPAILFNLIMGTIGAFQVFAVPRIMTDGGPNDATLFYVLNLYRRAFEYNEMGYACALAFILFAVIFIVSWLELRGSRRWVHYEGNK